MSRNRHRPGGVVVLLTVLIAVPATPTTAWTGEHHRSAVSPDTGPVVNTSVSLDCGECVRGGVTPGGGPGDGESYYVRVVETRDEAVATFNFSSVDGDRLDVVNETDFTASYLIVYQEFPREVGPDYNVTRVSRDGRTVRVELNESECDPSGKCAVVQVVVTETVIVRIERDDTRPEPDFAVVNGVNSSYSEITGSHVVSGAVVTYDGNDDGTISLSELATAAGDYSRDGIDIDELGRVAAAYARSPG